MNEPTGIIGLLGAKGSGKSTVAKHLAQTYGAEVISFAAPLKKMCAELLSRWPVFDFIERDPPDYVPDPDGEPAYVRLAFVPPSFDEALALMTGTLEVKETPIRGLHITPRWLMQVMGTEMCRQYLGADIWANAAVAYIRRRAAEGQRLFVIDDLRFPNEGRILRQISMGPDPSEAALVIKLTCSDDVTLEEFAGAAAKHASEDIDAFPAELIDEALVSHRSEASQHLLGEFQAVMERLGQYAGDDKDRFARIVWVLKAMADQRLAHHGRGA